MLCPKATTNQEWNRYFELRAPGPAHHTIYAEGGRLGAVWGVESKQVGGWQR